MDKRFIDIYKPLLTKPQFCILPSTLGIYDLNLPIGQFETTIPVPHYNLPTRKSQAKFGQQTAIKQRFKQISAGICTYEAPEICR
jgi:hypothetical protein